MNPKENGEIAEAKAIAMLKEEGFTVSIPFGENARYDVIIDDGDLIKCQIKKAWEMDGGIKFKTSSTGYNSNGHKENGYDDSEIDCFIVVYGDSLYRVDIDRASSGGMKLRIEPTANNQQKGINFAKDFAIC